MYQKSLPWCGIYCMDCGRQWPFVSAMFCANVSHPKENFHSFREPRIEPQPWSFKIHPGNNSIKNRLKPQTNKQKKAQIDASLLLFCRDPSVGILFLNSVPTVVPFRTSGEWFFFSPLFYFIICRRAELKICGLYHGVMIEQYTWALKKKHFSS